MEYMESKMQDVIEGGIQQAAEICGAIGKTRDGIVDAVCQQPKGHTGYHGGMGCEWNDAACVQTKSAWETAIAQSRNCGSDKLVDPTLAVPGGLLFPVPCIAFFLFCFLSSCVVYDHEAVSSTGNKEHDKLWSLGGTNSQHGADGSSLVTDHQASFQQAVQAIGTVAAGAAAASVSKAMETTKQLSNAAAAKTAQAQISATAATTNATTAARTTVTGQAIQANPGAVVPPPITPP